MFVLRGVGSEKKRFLTKQKPLGTDKEFGDKRCLVWGICPTGVDSSLIPLVFFSGIVVPAPEIQRFWCPVGTKGRSYESNQGTFDVQPTELDVGIEKTRAYLFCGPDVKIEIKITGKAQKRRK